MKTLGISKAMLSLLESHGIRAATPVQLSIIPAILAGRDVLAQSETGSGKTISFAVPIIEQTERRHGLAALVLVPTRELCVQVSKEFTKFSSGKHLAILPVYGGVSIADQIARAKSSNVIVATPGRLIDLLDRREVSLDSIRYLVFDEADRMLDMGFINDIEKILKRVPKRRQTMLFSATVPKEIAELSHRYLHDPVRVHLPSAVKAELLRQVYYVTTPERKLQTFIHLLKHERDLSLVFCNRKHVTSRLAKKLAAHGVPARCLHGDLSQPKRERVIDQFRRKKFSVLVATDVAARGLHIEDISHVYNYEIPRDVESYTHRIGRTARAGKRGEAISLVATPDEQKFFKHILFHYPGSIALRTLDGKIPEAAPSRRKHPEPQAHQRRNEKPHGQNEAKSRREDPPEKSWRDRWQRIFKIR